MQTRDHKTSWTPFIFDIDPFSEPGEKFNGMNGAICVRKGLEVGDRDGKNVPVYESAIITHCGQSDLSPAQVQLMIDGLKLAVDKANELDNKYKPGDEAAL